jgi:hypothetical protein
VDAAQVGRLDPGACLRCFGVHTPERCNLSPRIVCICGLPFMAKLSMASLPHVSSVSRWVRA